MATSQLLAPRRRFGYALVAVLALLLMGTEFGRQAEAVRARVLSYDCDGYWHLLRVADLHRGGSWDNEVNARGNAPYGERLHWTHAMDLVLWGGATIGGVFTDFDSALYWWGALVGPAFYASSLLVTVLFGRFLVGPRHEVLLGLVFVSSLALVPGVYSANRADHHCLVAFAFVVYYCLFVALLARPQSLRLSVATGLVGALGVWCGVEVLVLIGLSACYLALLWLVRGERYLVTNLGLAGGLLVGLAIVLLVDVGLARFWTPVHDRLSAVHVGASAALWLFWSAMLAVTRTGGARSGSSRVGLAALGGVPMALGAVALLPHGATAGLSGDGSGLYRLYLKQTGEFRPLHDDPARFAHTVLLVGPALLYAVVAAWSNDRNERVKLSWFSVTLALYFAMSLLTTRWTLTLAYLHIAPTTLLVSRLLSCRVARLRPVVAGVGAVVLVMGPYAPLMTGGPPSDASARERQDARLELVRVLAFISSELRPRPQDTVLADMYIGPAILYHSCLRVVGTPNHSNAQGILDTYRILRSQDDEEARVAIAARGIRYVLLNDDLREFARLGEHSGTVTATCTEERTFVGRLSLGRLPRWITEVTLPAELGHRYRLFRVADLPQFETACMGSPVSGVDGAGPLPCFARG